MQVGRQLKAQCPYCGSDVLLGVGIEQWDAVTCNDCLTELQVVTLNPPELDYLWEDEWDDDDLEYDALDLELDELEGEYLEDDWDDETDDD